MTSTSLAVFRGGKTIRQKGFLNVIFILKLHWKLQSLPLLFR